MQKFLKKVILNLSIALCCYSVVLGQKGNIKEKSDDSDKSIFAYTEQIKLVTSIIGTASVIFAALTFSYNIRSKETERKREQAKSIKQYLGDLDTNIYLLEWTTITKSHVGIMVTKVMQKIKEELNEPIDKKKIENILSNSLKIELLLESVWHESSEIKKIENYMANFSKSETFLNYHFPFLYKPLNDYSGKLRVIYISDVGAGINFRDTSKMISEFNELLNENSNPLDALQIMLYRYLEHGTKDSTSINRELFKEFYKFSNTLDHNAILKLSEFARKNNRQAISPIQKLDSIRTYISKKINPIHTAKILELLEQYIHLQRNSDEARFIKFLSAAKKAHPTDPDIDVFLAVLVNEENDKSLELLKDAEKRGANLRISEGELKERYNNLWNSNSLD